MSLKPACSYEHASKNKFLITSMQEKMLFSLFLPKCIKDIANGRLLANEKSQLESSENNVSSSQNKQIAGRCIRL